MGDDVVVLVDVDKSYNGYVVFRGLNFAVKRGEFVGIFAPSGYGKSTIIHLIAGIDKPDRGRIFVDGVEVSSLSEKESALFRRKRIGIVFQFFNLFPTLTALENVMLPLELMGVKSSEAKKRSIEVLKLVGLGDKLHRFPAQLSGGEQQRVAIARALVTEPAIILADEPTGNLDERNAISIFELLKEINRDRGSTILMATHDKEHASKYVTRAVTIRDKKIVEML